MTEQDIRAAIEARLDAEAGHVFDTQADLTEGLERVAVAAADPLAESGRQTREGGGIWEPLDVAPEGTLWADLRPSEAVPDAPRP